MSTTVCRADGIGASATIVRVLSLCSLTAGVDVRGFCQTFFADGVPFFIDFHLAKGDEQVQLSPWRNHHNMGRVRELQFITQLKVRTSSGTLVSPAALRLPSP